MSSMETIIDGSNHSVTLTNPTTNVITASWDLFNEDNESILSEQLITPTGSETSFAISVDGQHNELPLGKNMSINTIKLSLENSSGVNYQVIYSYFISADSFLSIPSQSFQSYNKALITRKKNGRCSGWDMATEDERKDALMEAVDNIDSFDFDLTQATEFSDFPGFEPEDIGKITLMTPTEFAALPSVFRSILERAQVYEADYILGGDPTSKKRDQGIMSETIHESSMMFRPGNPLKKRVCDRAMRILAPFIYKSNRLARA